ncbi:MAG: ABC transporter ATP-binding protein [Synechococcaceae cyanobacterium SM2_3_1]|nr:ABC transporter ATP-binding protein [Synechococcaceae cyanobacterium SM2_3_1]
MLVATDLHKSYGQVEVVRGIDLTLASGQVLGLLGPNGAGKSTTVGMLYGLVKPTRGQVQLKDFDVHRQGALARRYMGVVTQDNNLDPDLDVLDNLLFFARHYRLVGREAQHRAAELLEIVNLLGRERSSVDSLSGGMQRRLVLARALLNHPLVIFLDEPTTGLDPDARQEFWRLVVQLKHRGHGVLLTTHYMDEAERLCDHLMLLQEGRVVDQGTPQDLIKRTIGEEVVEVEGLTAEVMETLAVEANTWWQPFSTGYLMVLPDSDPQAVIMRIESLHPTRLLQRRANLEDVFLRLTGVRL